MKTVFGLFVLLFALTASTFAVDGTNVSETITKEKVWTILVYEYNESVHTSVVSKELDCESIIPTSEELSMMSCSHVAPKNLNQTLSRITKEHKSRLIPYSQAVRELGLE